MKDIADSFGCKQFVNEPDAIEERRKCARDYEFDLARPDSFLSRLQRNTKNIGIRLYQGLATDLIGEGIGNAYEWSRLKITATKQAVGRVIDFFTDRFGQVTGAMLVEVGTGDEGPVPAGTGDLVLDIGDGELPGIVRAVPFAVDGVTAVRFVLGTDSIYGEAGPELTPSLVHADPDPRVSYGPPLVSDDGTLYVARAIGSVSCGFGLCTVDLQKISPTGGWILPSDSDTLATRGLAFGPDGRVYFGSGRSTLHAHRPDSTAVPGWPFVYGGDANAVFRGTFVDDDTGQVHLTAWSGFVGGARLGVTLNPDGSEAWHVPNADIGHMMRGPGGDIYLQNQDVVRFDRRTGAERCRIAPILYQVYSLGTPEGLFGSRYNEVYRLNGDCIQAPFYSTTGPYITMLAYDDGHGSPDRARLVVAESGGSIQQPTTPTLTGLTMTGNLAWRQPEIDTPTLWAARDGIAYVAGRDVLDNLRDKLFFVDTATGTITARIDRVGICDSGCSVGIGSNQQVYLSAGNKIYRLQ